MLLRCSRCGLDLAPEAFAPSHRTPGDWCRACRREYMRRYKESYTPPQCVPTCGACGEELPRIGGCLNGCRQTVSTAKPVLRTATCTICDSPFVLPFGARGNLKTCSADRCNEVRIRQRKAAQSKDAGGPKARGVKPAHYRGNYHVTARAVRQAAYANPDTRCWRCGLKLQDHRPHKNGKPARWTAGHVVDGQAGGPLAPEASTCNFRAGAVAGNAARTSSTRTELTW